MVKKLTLLILILSILGLSYEVHYQIPDNLVSGKSGSIIITLMGDFNAYEGEAIVHPSVGRIKGGERVEFVGGSAVVEYIPPSDFYGEVVFRIDIGLEVHEFKAVVFPDASLMEKGYLEVSEFVGKVFIKRFGERVYRSVSEGMQVFEGDEIVTQEDSYAVLTGKGGVKLTVYPQTRVIITDLRKSGKLTFVKVNVDRGNLIPYVEEKIQKIFLVVEGKGVTAGVRGTILGFEVSDEVRVRNFEGKIWVMAAGKYMDLPSGKMMRFGSEALVEFEMMQKEALRKFHEMEKELMEGFEEKARRMLSMFGMEDVFTIDLRDFVQPLDRSLDSFEDMIRKLRKMHMKRGGKR